jgi:hypothetical protein
VLQGASLSWYKHQRQSSPQGSVVLGDDSVVQLVEGVPERACVFKVTGPDVPEGLFMQCKDAKELRAWLAACSGVKAANAIYQRGLAI